jgi:hypothetical protein
VVGIHVTPETGTELSSLAVAVGSDPHMGQPGQWLMPGTVAPTQQTLTSGLDPVMRAPGHQLTEAQAKLPRLRIRRDCFILVMASSLFSRFDLKSLMENKQLESNRDAVLILKFLCSFSVVSRPQ